MYGFNVSLRKKIYIGSNIKIVMLLKNGKEIVVNEPIGQNFEFLDENKNYFVTWKPDHTIVIKA